MKNKRVVHISTVHSWQDPRIFQKECKSLVEHGYEVHLITPDGLDRKIDGVMVHKLQYKIKNRIDRYLRASKKVFRQAESLDPKIIHFHDPELIPEGIKLKKKGYQIIYDIHEDNITAIDERQYIPSILKSLVKLIVSYFEDQARNNLHTIIAEKYYEKRFPKAVKVLNYPVVDWVKSKSDSNSIFNGVIYTGNVRIDRGALNHANILNNFNGIEFWSYGKCSNELFHKMKKVAGKNADKLNVIGVDDYVSFEKIAEAYNERKWLAGLAIFPRSDHFEEKHLTKFFEYMAVGIPIIYSCFEEWKQFLDPLNVGLSVNPNDESSVIEALEKLINEPDTWESMSKNGVRVVKEKYNWKIQEKNLIEIYSSL